MTQSSRSVYHLALRDMHAVAGARFEERDEWILPADYGNPGAEYAALREAAVVFDRSHRSRFLVTGTDAEVVLGKVLQGHPNELDEGRAMRTVALDGQGNIRDLVLAARTGGIAYLISAEPGQRAETLERLRAAAESDFDVRFEDRTESTCLIGLAGPAASEIARAHLSDGLPARLQLLGSVTFEFHGFRAMATRTSDTGEDGFELTLAPAVAQHVVETLMEAGVRPAGSTALESARVESCIPAFAPDLQTGLSPAEADLDVLLGIPGGRDRQVLSALLLDAEAPPPPGSEIREGETLVGVLRSCVRSFGLNATIGLGIIESQRAQPGRQLSINARGATVVAKPFYRRRPQG
jgi:aminomethyltransferase